MTCFTPAADVVVVTLWFLGAYNCWIVQNRVYILLHKQTCDAVRQLPIKNPALVASLVLAACQVVTLPFWPVWTVIGMIVHVVELVRRNLT